MITGVVDLVGNAYRRLRTPFRDRHVETIGWPGFAIDARWAHVVFGRGAANTRAPSLKEGFSFAPGRQGAAEGLGVIVFSRTAGDLSFRPVIDGIDHGPGGPMVFGTAWCEGLSPQRTSLC